MQATGGACGTDYKEIITTTPKLEIKSIYDY
jgi:hypothetical protein